VTRRRLNRPTAFRAAAGSAGSSLVERAVEQQSCLFPPPLHGALGDILHVRDLGEREAAEEPQADDLREFGLERGKLVQGLADALQELGLGHLVGVVGVERRDDEVTTALVRVPGSNPIDDQPTHRACGIGEESTRAFEREGGASAHVGGVASDFAPRQAAQIGVERGEQSLRAGGGQSAGHRLVGRARQGMRAHLDGSLGALDLARQIRVCHDGAGGRASLIGSSHVAFDTGIPI